MDFPPAKVLLAADGSKDAALASWAAANVCEVTGAELHVIHAWHTVPTTRLRPFMRGELKRLGEELLEKGVRQVEEAGGRLTDAHLVEGRAADEILHLAEDIGAGLVVIGSRGLGGRWAASSWGASPRASSTTPTSRSWCCAAARVRGHP